MTIDDLITELQAVKNEHGGDTPMAKVTDSGDIMPINGLKYRVCAVKDAQGNGYVDALCIEK